jgi:hypothetical protein
MKPQDAIELRLQSIVAGLRKTGVVSGTSGTKVIVTVEGASMTLPRLSSYTSPAVADVVRIDAHPSGWLVLGKIA